VAWDEYRRKRDPDRETTAEIPGVPAPSRSGDADPPVRSGRDWQGWGQRFGWMVAVGVSMIALLLAGAALAHSGHNERRGGFGRSAGFDGGGAPSFDQRQAPPGLGGGFGDGPGSGRQ
jgi:hypothetical protein